MSRLLIPSITSRLRSRTRKEFPLINRDSSSLENSSKTAELFRTTTSKKSQLSTQFLDLEVVVWNLLLQLLLKSTTARRRCAEIAMPDFLLRLLTAERESADTPTISESRRNPRNDVVFAIFKNCQTNHLNWDLDCLHSMFVMLNRIHIRYLNHSFFILIFK